MQHRAALPAAEGRRISSETVRARRNFFEQEKKKPPVEPEPEHEPEPEADHEPELGLCL